jgi:hypothetical protein
MVVGIYMDSYGLVRPALHHLVPLPLARLYVIAN